MLGRRIPKDDHERLRRTIENSLKRIYPRLSADLRGDVTQRALIKLCRHSERNEGIEDYSGSYIYRAAYNALADELRKIERRLEVAWDDESMALPSERPDPEQQSAWRETAQGIRECIGRLPSGQAQALSLVLLGHSVPEVASLRSCTRKQAENLVYRARKTVRACLRAKGIEP